MIVHTHFEVTNAFDPSAVNRMLEVWARSWERMGWETLVTTGHLSEGDELTSHYQEKVVTFPSANPAGFDRASFNRWINAYWVSKNLGKGIVSVENDVMNYGWHPRDSLEAVTTRLVIADKEGCPCLAIGLEADFEKLCRAILAHEVGPEDAYHGIPHLSDQDFIARYYKPFYDSREDLIENVGDGVLWHTSSLVHFGNPFLRRYGMYQHGEQKVDVIQRLRPIS